MSGAKDPLSNAVGGQAAGNQAQFNQLLQQISTIAKAVTPPATVGYTLLSSKGIPATQASLTAADIAAAAAGNVLVVNENVTQTAAITLTAAEVKFLGGIITTNGHNLQINGVVDAAPTQIFSTGGGGTVLLQQVSTVYPEWWGGVLYAGASGTAAFAAMAATLNAVGGGHVILQVGVYVPGNPTFTAPVYISGQGPSISAGGNGTRVVAVTNGQAFTWTGAVGGIFGGGIADLSVQANNASGGVIVATNMWTWNAKNVHIFDANGGASTTDIGILIKGKSFEALVDNCRLEDVGAIGQVVLDSSSGVFPNGTIIHNCDMAPQNHGCSFYDKGSTGSQVLTTHFEFGGTDGGYHIRCSNADSLGISENFFGNNGSGGAVAQISIEGTSEDTTITNNPTITVISGDGIKIASTALTTKIIGNGFEPSAGGWCINNNGSTGLIASLNSCKVGSGATATGFILQTNSADTGIIIGNEVYGYPAAAPTFVGIQADAGCIGNTIIGNVVQWISSGINLQVNNSSPTTVFLGNNITNNTVNITIAHPLSVTGDGTFTGTGSLVFSASPTLTGTAGFASLTASGSLTYTAASSGPILKQGANGRVGTFVCNGVTPVTVGNTSVAITDAIIISLNTVGGTVGALPVLQTITASTGFTVAGTALDTSTYNYTIIKNSA